MTQIDRVSFDFVVPGEGIASGLLSGWDAFCHRCFEQVVEEFFAPYDREDVRYAFDQVELDLGAIPEADFYRLYPLRLKEALQRSVFFTGKHIRNREGVSGHLEDILYGLKYGTLRERGTERDIDTFFAKEINWLLTQPETVKSDCLNGMASLALSEEGALRRMILHFDNDDLLLGVFGAGLAKPDYTVWQKNRFLLSFLELAGSVPVRFIHESDGKNDLSRMAELLDSGSVWKIMQIEMTRQSKPGLAFYWHYLYEWLLRYYPYNDVSLFGGKSQFVNHLHFRFLTFVHKQPFLSFYSEYDLTVQFLQEIFGHDKYLSVSDAINRLLCQNVGNVTHHSRYGESLYLSFLRISQLYHRETDRNRAEPETVLSAAAEIKALVQRSAKQPYSKEAFQAVRFAGVWLKEHARNREMVTEYLAPVANASFVDGMLASVSLALLDDVRRVKQVVLANRGAFSWMQGLLDDKLEEAWNRSVLLWLSESGHSGPYDIEKLLVRFHKEISGSENTAEEEALVRLCREPQPPQEEPVAPESGGVSIRELVRKRALRVFSGEALASVLSVFDWIGDHLPFVESHLFCAEREVWLQVLLWLVRQKDGEASEHTDAGQSLLSYLFDEQIVAFIRGDAKLATLAQAGLREETRRRILEYFLGQFPQELLQYVHGSIQRGEIAEAAWCAWLSPEDWRNLTHSISVSVAESFIRIFESLHLDRREEGRVWTAFFARYGVERWRYNTLAENVAQFVEVLSACCPDKAQACAKIVSAFVPPVRTEPAPKMPEEEVERYRIGNAGLCLLFPWLLRLYDRLGYLDPERKRFRDTYSRIRAIFLLQYLVYGEERMYPESDLAFNRLLADIPFHVPLPREFPLTDEERETADGMLAGVKANWRQMDGTSVSGFRRSFIARDGRLMRNEDRWTLVVEEKAFDVLLDTVPWGFRQIILPWINGFVQVNWRNGQTI